MEEEASSRCSVAELAGRFKGSAAPHDAAGQQTEKPVRRRPPRSLQLPKTSTDDQEPPAGVTSPQPPKAKRNSALIEKLQANLALSPTALTSPKSPGFRLLPPTFPTPSSGSAPSNTATSTPSTPTPVTPVLPSPSAEEGPASFEAPPTAAEGAILTNINKGRARHSLRRRPPSRRHRKSCSEDDIDSIMDGGDASLTSPKDETREEQKKEDGADEVKEVKTETKNETNEEERSEVNAKPREEDKKEEEKKEEEEKEEEKKEEKKKEVEGGTGNKGDRSSSEGAKEEKEEKEENSAEKQEESTETSTNTEKEEAESQGAASQSSTS